MNGLQEANWTLPFTLFQHARRSTKAPAELKKPPIQCGQSGWRSLSLTCPGFCCRRSPRQPGLSLRRYQNSLLGFARPGALRHLAAPGAAFGRRSAIFAPGPVLAPPSPPLPQPPSSVAPFTLLPRPRPLAPHHPGGTGRAAEPAHLLGGCARKDQKVPFLRQIGACVAVQNWAAAAAVARLAAIKTSRAVCSKSCYSSNQHLLLWGKCSAYCVGERLHGAAPTCFPRKPRDKSPFPPLAAHIQQQQGLSQLPSKNPGAEGDREVWCFPGKMLLVGIGRGSYVHNWCLRPRSAGTR